MRRCFRLASAWLAIPFIALAWCEAASVGCPSTSQSGHNEQTLNLAVGVSSCAAAACHGGDGSEVGVASAYSRWKSRDPHARAGEALHGPLAQSIAEVLQSTGVMPKNERPSNSPMCVQCHGSPAAASIGNYTSEEGVSCEQCHGRGEAYLDKHFEPSWKSLDLSQKAHFGMSETKNLRVRAQTCLKCHQGAPGFEVTHDLIAAGHPLLRFEFRSYLAHYRGKHWREPIDHDAAGRQVRGEAAFDLAAWVVGQQASAIAAANLAVSRRSHGSSPVDFANADCIACHRNLLKQLAEPTTPRLGGQTWFGWQESGLRLAAPATAEGFASFARNASALESDSGALQREAAALDASTPPALPRSPVRPQLQRLFDYPMIEREGWEAALQRRLAAEAMVAAARETYEETWVHRPGIEKAIAKLRQATAEWQSHRPSNVVAAWRVLEESLNAALDD